MRTEIEAVGAVILAGGKSSRMGSDKALLPFGKERLIDHMVRILSKQGCSPLMVSGHVEGYHCIEDILPQAGPVGGIHAAIQTIAGEKDWPRAWLFVPVDMPLLTPSLLARLYSCPCTYDHDGACFENRPLPLFLRLHDHVVKIIENVGSELAASSELSVRRLLEKMEICKHPVSEEDKKQLTNVNTPEDWQRITAA